MLFRTQQVSLFGNLQHSDRKGFRRAIDAKLKNKNKNIQTLPIECEKYVALYLYISLENLQIHIWNAIIW